MRFSQIYVGLIVPTTMAMPAAFDAQAQKCTDGAVVFAIRGSDDQQTTLDPNPRFADLPSGMTAAANAAINKVGKKSYLSPVKYPAIQAGSPEYSQSVAMGIVALQGAINDYTKACKNGEIVVLGYSQGGQVTTAALTQGVNDPKRIKAGVIYADPTFLDGLSPLDAGSASNSGAQGILSDSGIQTAMNTQFGDRFRSFCQTGDAVCDSGSSTQEHIDNPQHFQKRAIDFLNGKV